MTAPESKASQGLTLSKTALGRLGEDYACEILLKAGLAIIKRNYRCPKGEIDIIAREGTQLVFMEVRTRSSSFRGWGEESITAQKLKRLHTVASYYLLENGYKEWPNLRFDVIAIRQQAGLLEHNWLRSI